LTSLPNDAYALGLFPSSGTGCSGSPVVCAPAATTTSIGNLINDTALTPRLLFAIGDTLGLFTETFHLYAFDAAGSSGCSGSPTVCAPLLDLTLPKNTRSLEIWDGRVYTVAPDGIHVFSLPGAIS